MKLITKALKHYAEHLYDESKACEQFDPERASDLKRLAFQAAREAEASGEQVENKHKPFGAKLKTKIEKLSEL